MEYSKRKLTTPLGDNEKRKIFNHKKTKTMKAIQINTIETTPTEVIVEVQYKNYKTETLEFSKTVIAEKLGIDYTNKGINEIEDTLNHLGEHNQDEYLILWEDYEFNDNDIEKFLILEGLMHTTEQIDEWNYTEEIAKARINNFIERMKYSQNPVENIEAEMIEAYLKAFEVELN